jgi:hypothetical protein
VLILLLKLLVSAAAGLFSPASILSAFANLRRGFSYVALALIVYLFAQFSRS